MTEITVDQQQVANETDDATHDVAGYRDMLVWRPSPLECMVWQGDIRQAVAILTFGLVSNFTPNCSQMPPPSGGQA